MIEKSCVVCGAKFMVWPAREKTAQTCSRECRGKVDAQRYKEGRIKISCKACGRVFLVPKCHASRRIYCSADCADPHRKPKSATGENHHLWNGGITEHADGYLYRLVRNHPFGGSRNYVFDHRLVVEQWMREEVPDHRFLTVIDGVSYLRPEIDVHHINLNKRDNRKANLLACTPSAHNDVHNGRAPMVGEVWPEIKGMVPYSPRWLVRVCKTCGINFRKKRSDVKRGGGHYCSRLCSDKRLKTPFEIVTT